jgi:K+-sensing histidine kinase KdpD
MEELEGSRRARIAITVGALCLTALVGFVDSQVMYVVFSIFYLIPVFLAAWFVGRRAGLAAAIASAVVGLAADLWSSPAPAVFAYVNSLLRLALFAGAALVVSRLHESIAREREVAAREQAAAEQLKEVAQLRSDLMRAVAEGAQEPLAQIYARVVNLGFDLSTTPEAESRVVLTEIAQASAHLSRLVDSLLQEDQELVGAAPGGITGDDAPPAQP